MRSAGEQRAGRAGDRGDLGGHLRRARRPRRPGGSKLSAPACANASAAASSPNRTPGCFWTIRARARASAGTVASEVTSPSPTSSASALATSSARLSAISPSREDRDRRREPVQEVAAADRADLAGAEEAAGRRAERVLERQRVVVGGLEHVRAAAVAGEQQRPGRAVRRRAPGPGRAAPRAGPRRRSRRRGRACAPSGRRARARRARATRPRDRRRGSAGRGSRRARRRAGSRRSRSPASAPGRRAPARAGSSSPIASRRRSIAGFEASSSITLPRAAVIVISGPTGVAPCETQGSISTPVDAGGDRAPVEHLAVAKQRRRPGGGGAREAAEHRHPGPLGVQRAEQRLGAERVGIGEHDHAVAERAGIRQPADRDALVGRLRLEVMGRDRRLGRRQRPDHRARAALELAPGRRPRRRRRSRSATAARAARARSERIGFACVRCGAPANTIARSQPPSSPAAASAAARSNACDRIELVGDADCRR